MFTERERERERPRHGTGDSTTGRQHSTRAYTEQPCQNSYPNPTRWQRTGEETREDEPQKASVPTGKDTHNPARSRDELFFIGFGVVYLRSVVKKKLIEVVDEAADGPYFRLSLLETFRLLFCAPEFSLAPIKVSSLHDPPPICFYPNCT